MSQHFLPDLCQLGAVIYIVLLAQILALLLALGAMAYGADFWSALSWHSLFIFWVALISAGVLCAMRGLMMNWTDLQAGCFALGLILCVTLLVSASVLHVLPSLELLLPPPASEMPMLYLRNLGISFVVAGMLLRYLYVQQQWRRQTQAQLESRLDALQARIRPHFLFNSLNTIASLAQSDPVLCESLVEDLAELFRASMKSNARMVPLADELDLARKYLNIEQNRLGARLQVETDLAALPMDAHLPPLTLQPLIENAVYHGIERSAGPATLRIRGEMKGGQIVITISNPVVGAEPVRSGNHMALETLRARIEGCFPDAGQLRASIVDGQYQILLLIPYRQSAK